MPITFSEKIVRLKVYIIFSQSDDLDLHSRSQLRLKLDTFLSCCLIVIGYLGQYYVSYGIQTWNDGRLVHGIYYVHAHSDYLDLDARSQWLCRGEKKSIFAMAFKLRMTVDLCVHARFDDIDLDLDFEIVCKDRPSC